MEAYFTASSTTNLNFSKGVFLTSGSCVKNDTALAGIANAGPDGPEGPSSNFQSVPFYKPGDADLDLLTSGVTNDAAVLEFDFIPKSDTVRFRYRFASEEYNIFVNTVFNDVFGFFLSGVNVAYPKTNIALIPGTNVPVSINTVNNGQANFGAGSGPCSNCSYFIDNTSGSVDVVYNGITKILTAMAKVECGKKYHIKLAVADVSDGTFDSGVFLEAGSFSSEDPISITCNYADSAISEGCGTGSIYYVRPKHQSANAITYTFALSGTATNGVDFTPALPVSITFPPGKDSVVFNFTAVNEGIVEPIEYIKMVSNQTFFSCGGPVTAEFKFYIKPPLILE